MRSPGAGALRVNGEMVEEKETLEVMQGILENRFSLVDLSNLNERQERSTMNAVVMGLLAYDDRGFVLMNGERQKCKAILTSSLEKLRANFARQCPQVEACLQGRLTKRCKVSAKTAGNHVRHMFVPLNSSRQSSPCSLPTITLRTLREREDADAELFLPLLLIELLADLVFYRDATSTDDRLQKMEEHMGYRSLVPLALRELEKQEDEALAGEGDPPVQGMATDSRVTCKVTRKRPQEMTSKLKTAPKRPRLDASRVVARVALAPREDQGSQVAIDHHLLEPSSPRECTPLGPDRQTLPAPFAGATCGESALNASSASVWVEHDVYEVLQYDSDPYGSEVMWYEQILLDEHLLGMLRGPCYEEEEVPLISTAMPRLEHDLLFSDCGVPGPCSPLMHASQEECPQCPSPPAPQVDAGVADQVTEITHYHDDFVLLDVLDGLPLSDIDMMEAIRLQG